ncbi:MAG: S-methyl-5-thioribose-1-phosphate isomerase [Polyangiaceae bacterium]|nr:S-methyl-5-thioribose-1-phosphate isomerase [Polyangiaceae bacterium]
MRVNDEHRRTIALASDGWSVDIIDQTKLPDRFEIVRIRSVAEMAHAIRVMQVRGAPLIGVSAAFGLCLALREDPSDVGLERAWSLLHETRPTAVNLRWALDRMKSALQHVPPGERVERAYTLASEITEEDVATCEKIGEHGAAALREIYRALGQGRPLRVLTHCNAGWLATVDWGTALSPIYRLHDEGVPVEVWVDETRPRNQGYLTAWELGQHGVPNTVIADNAGGHYMQQGAVDVVIVGSDRTTRTGDVCNKIGTYLKALAAHDNGVPFFAAVPSSTIDFRLRAGRDIPIEMRSPAELHERPGVRAENPAFDVTPARFVTGIITERGVAAANETSLTAMFPDRA